MLRSKQKNEFLGKHLRTRLLAIIAILHSELTRTALAYCPASDYLLVAGHETQVYDTPVVAFRNNYQDFLLA